MLNRVTLMGRLTATPELKQTPSGVSVVSFSVACDRNFADKDGGRACDFINIVAWRGTAEFVCKYFEKGRMVALEGSIQTRNYEDRQGNKRTAVEVVADQVYFADSKQDKPPDKPKPVKAEFEISDFEEINDGELPF